MIWRAPIYNRTAADISARTARAFFNVADINRIEGNVAWLTAELSRFSFPAVTTSITNWNVHGVPTIADFQRIRANIDAIATAFHRPAGWQNMAGINFQSLDFNAVNILERNIFLLRQLLDGMISSFRQASFQSGQTLFLPQRRV